MMAILTQRSPDFPTALSRATEDTGFSRFWAIGDANILNNPLLGLLCSIRCPGRVIVQTYDLARALRDAGVPVTGGFHSPMNGYGVRLAISQFINSRLVTWCLHFV